MTLLKLYSLIAISLSSIGLFLSLWIVVPAPLYALLPLGVGAPEVSPWLLAGNAIALLLSLPHLSRKPIARVTLGLSLVGLLLSAMPLAQLPAADQRFNTAMETALGKNYLARLPQDVSTQLRSQPFTLVDAFRGIPTAPVRYTPGIQFATPQGVPLSLNIYRPPQVGKYPTVIVIYGGAWQRGSPSQDGEFSRYLAARGYTIIAIAYRHAPEHRFPAQLEDVQTALQFIRQQAATYEVDLERVALLGRSAGAHLAMLAAYQPSPLAIQAVVNYYGPVDLTVGYFDPPHPDPIDTRAILRSFLGGTPQDYPDLYRLASPITYVTRPLPPTLLIYGGRDHLVQAKFGRRLSDRLQATGTTAVFLEIPWAEHAFDAVFNGVSNQLALYYTERFLAWALR